MQREEGSHITNGAPFDVPNVLFVSQYKNNSSFKVAVYLDNSKTFVKH